MHIFKALHDLSRHGLNPANMARVEYFNCFAVLRIIGSSRLPRASLRPLPLFGEAVPFHPIRFKSACQTGNWLLSAYASLSCYSLDVVVMIGSRPEYVRGTSAQCTSRREAPSVLRVSS